MLVVDDVHFEYKGRPVLGGVDLRVGTGEMVGVVGPNGVGKTTLLRIISGVLGLTRGTVKIDGRDMAGLTAAQRARLVSVVPQTPQLPLGFSVRDLVLMGRNPHLKLLQWEGRRDLEVAARAMDLTETDHLADRPVGTLSGGERQRVLVAMALAQEAPVMLLDEPTASLDLVHQTGIMDLVRDIQRRREGTVVVAMHDLTLASQYCHRLVMLCEGRVYAEGPPEEVLTSTNISEVYGAEALVLPHPMEGKPVVLPLPRDRAAHQAPDVEPTSARSLGDGWPSPSP